MSAENLISKKTESLLFNLKHGLDGIIDPNLVLVSYSSKCGEKSEIVESLAEGVLHHAYITDGALDLSPESLQKLMKMGIAGNFLGAVMQRAKELGATKLVVGKNEQVFVGAIRETNGQPVQIGFVFERDLAA